MEQFVIYTDGGSRNNPGQAAIGVSVVNQAGEEIYSASHAIGIATNNEAEYQAFITSLDWVHQHSSEITALEWRLDSQLVVQQLQGNWKVKEARLQHLVSQAQHSLRQLQFPYTIVYVPRAQNARADQLVNQALDALAETTVH